MIRLYKLPSQPHLLGQGLREMEDRDISEVKTLYAEYQQRFNVVHLMSTEEIRHVFLSGRGRGEMQNGRREGQVVWSFVVEVSRSPATGGQSSKIAIGSANRQGHRFLHLLHTAVNNHRKHTLRPSGCRVPILLCH